MRRVEFFADGHSPFGTVLVFKCEPDDAHVDFEVHLIEGQDPKLRDASADPMAGAYYENYNWTSGADLGPDLAEACPQVRGMVKWDGCSHVYFGNAEAKGEDVDGYLHLCGAKDWRWLTASMGRVLDRCRELLGDKWDGET